MSIIENQKKVLKSAQESFSDIIAWMDDVGRDEVQELLGNLTANAEGIIAIGIENPLFIHRIKLLATVAICEALGRKAQAATAADIKVRYRAAAVRKWGVAMPDADAPRELPPGGTYLRTSFPAGGHRLNMWYTEMNDKSLGLVEKQVDRL